MKTVLRIYISFFLLFFMACKPENGSAAKAKKVKSLTKKSSNEEKFEKELMVLLKEKKNIDDIKLRGLPLLYWAVQFYYKNSVKILLEKGASANIKAKKGIHETVIFSTIRSKSFADDALDIKRVADSKAIAELLIKHGADVKYTTPIGISPLHKAALRGRTDLCELFLKHGAKVNGKDLFAKTALHYAAEEGYWKTVQFLLKNKAIKAPVSKFKKTPLALAKERSEEKLNKEIRKEARSDYNIESDYSKTIKLLSK